MKQFEVRKDAMGDTRVRERTARELQEGEVLAKVRDFAFTANNVTYGVVGEKIGYWKFFPVDDEWGVIPVWGFAEVTESRSADIERGELLYGFLPTATHVYLRPGKVSAERMIDVTDYRRELPAVYNSYARVANEAGYEPAMDAERMLLFPLFATSFCLYDYLVDNAFFGATQVIVGSASSKTAIGLAYALQNESAVTRVGLTSARNHSAVVDLGVYDQVVTYDDLLTIDSGVPNVIVDMSGNGDVLSALHEHLGDAMRFTSNVGLTHYSNSTMGPAFIRERSAMFFAPGHIKKRAAEWGPGVFESKALAFWRGAAEKSGTWLNIDRRSGMESLERAYREVLSGESSPVNGIVVAL